MNQAIKIENHTVLRDIRPKGKVMNIYRRSIHSGKTPGTGSEQIEYLTFPALEESGMVDHLFSTRLGGVSSDCYGSMNLSFTRGDDANNVQENYSRIAQVLGCQTEDFVCSDQTHTSNIRRVEACDRGKGICIDKDYQDIDGLITDVAGLVLVTYFADCVPLFFLDPNHKAIGLAHSGWRGTVLEIGACMCQQMNREFGTNPEDLLVGIGPSICRECYEVDEKVAVAFQQMLQGTDEIRKEINRSGIFDSKVTQVVVPGKVLGKYQLDLWMANVIILRRAGVPLSNISVADLCTCHNPQYLFSHRASRGKRGSLAAFMKLRRSEGGLL